MMATFTAIKNKKQTAAVLGGVLKYVQQEKKTCAGGLRFVTGHNCVPQSAYTEMMTTKQRFKKTDGRQFYHFVQSFSADDDLTPQEANTIGLELAQREFPDFEVVVATHLDTNHLHNHLVGKTDNTLTVQRYWLLVNAQLVWTVCPAHRRLPILNLQQVRASIYLYLPVFRQAVYSFNRTLYLNDHPVGARTADKCMDKYGKPRHTQDHRN